MSLKIGDVVKVTHTSSVDYEVGLRVGNIYKVVAINDSSCYPVYLDGAPNRGMGYNQLDLIETNNLIMNLKQKVALLFKGEPEASFIKAGIMDSNENLTSEGQEVFMDFLLKKFGNDFKTEVVDKLLEADKTK